MPPVAAIVPDAPLADTAPDAPDAAVQADAGVDAAPAQKVGYADACRGEDIAPERIAGSPAYDHVGCSGVDLDGKPPCEAECNLQKEITKNPKSLEPMTMVTVHVVYFTMASRPPKEIGRFKTYDGPIDAGPLGVQAEIFIDDSTSPPTLELRPPTCSLAAITFDPHAPSPSGAPRDECRPLARYRYDGHKLRLVR